MIFVGCKVLHFINDEDQEALCYKTLKRTNTVVSHRGLCILVWWPLNKSYICLGLWKKKKNPKQIHQHGLKFRSENSEFVKLNRSSWYRACPVNLNRRYLSSYLLSFSKMTFLHLFLGSIFMSLIQPLDMYQTQLRSTQFTSKVRFDKWLTNYI